MRCLSGVRLLAASALAALVGVAAPPFLGAASEADLRLPALDGRLVAPLEETDAQATVFLFTTTDCPISNRYAPEVKRLHGAFAGSVTFWLVYADATVPVDDMRQHVEAYGYPFAAVRDPERELVKLTGVTITPEVAVYDAADRLVYRGRIDDRYVDFGVTRAAPTARDLHDVLQRVVAGETVEFSTTQAVGCYIPFL